MDTVSIVTFSLLAFSLAAFYFIGRFTVKLIKQHRNVYGLLYALEEEEKKKG